MTFETETLESQ